MRARHLKLASTVVACGALALSQPSAAQLANVTPQVREHFGNIEYTPATGVVRMLSKGGGFGEPVLSPDGRLAAFIHVDGPQDNDGPATSLWIADTLSGKSRRLIASSHDDEGAGNFSGLSGPTFSLDGNYLYVSGAYSAVSAGVHQVSIRSGTQRFVTAGAVISVIRTGPYRGYLIVGKHGYFAAPKSGSFNADYVVRPDGKEMFQIPGTTADSANRLAEWLHLKGWTAW